MLRSFDDRLSAVGRLNCAGLAYITFALRNPEYYTIMFNSPASIKTENRDSRQAGKDAFELLLNLVKDCREERRLPSEDSDEFALLAWSTIQ